MLLSRLPRFAHVRATVLLIFVQIDGELLVTHNIETVVDRDLHPTWSQALALRWVRILVSFGSLLAIHILVVDRDPTVVLAQETVRYVLRLLLFATRNNNVVVCGRSVLPRSCARIDVEMVWHRELSFVTV